MVWVPGFTIEHWARFLSEERRKDRVLSKAARALGECLSIPVEEARGGLNGALWSYEVQRTLANSERAAEAQERLRKVVKAADSLADALRGLGPAALAVLRRGGNVDPKMFLEADPYGLPERDPLESQPFQHPDATEEENRQWADEWRRGGRWLIRLEALATLAEDKAARIRHHAADKGPGKLGELLHGSPEAALARDCLRFVQQHGGPDTLARTMMVAVKEAHSGLKLKRGAARKALKKVSRPPSS